MENVSVVLTNNTLENIQIMAPLLDESSQNQVFGFILGVIWNTGNRSNDSQKKTR